MSKKLYLILALALAAAIILPACSRSASSSSAPTPTRGVVGTPQAYGGGATQDPAGMQNMVNTQTALAITTTALASITPTAGSPVPGGTAITPVASATPTGLVPGTGVPTTPVTPIATATRPASYTLKAGEYPYCIARRFNVNPTELLTLNGLISGNLFQPGLVLTIPQTGNPFPSPRYLVPHPTTYVVRVDDTIYTIGCYFGDVNPLDIAAVNRLVSPYTLTVGQSISIP
jgi:LysM repeat protein